MLNFTHIARTLATATVLTVSISAVAEVESRIIVTPAPGEVEALSNTYIIAPADGAKLTKGSNTDPIMMICLTDEGELNEITLSASVIGGNLRINFPMDIELPKAPGQYDIVVPAGRFAIDGEENEAIELLYTIPSEDTPDNPDVPDSPADPDSPEEPRMIVTPAPGEISEVGYWEISFNCEWGLYQRTAKFKVTGPDGVEIPAVRSMSIQTAYVVYLDGDVMLTTPGTYTLTVPAEKFVLDPTGKSIINEETVYTYTIVGEDDVYTGKCHVSPAPGSHLEEITEITVSYPNASSVEIADASVITLTDALDKSYPLEVSASGNTVTISAGSITDAYTYTLGIPAGALAIDGKQNNSIEAKYVIDVPESYWTGEYTVNPADGSELDAIESFELLFGAKDKVEINEFAAPSDFPALYNAGTGALIERALVYAEKNMLYVSINGGYKIPGQYKLVIPARLFTVNSIHMHEDIALNYTVKGSAAEASYSYTLAPAAGETIGISDNIMITFEGDDIASVSYDPYAWGNNAPHFTSTEGHWCPAIQIEAAELSFMLKHTWAFENYGEYALVIPAGYFTLYTTDGTPTPCEAITALYNVGDPSLIQSILGDDSAGYEIYNISGIRIASGARAEDIKALPAGIYVVNGQKLIIRK